jgi:hypothetical protein
MFGHLFNRGGDRDATELSAIDRAVSAVEPLLKHTDGYPENFREPVANALAYAHSLAAGIPGPVAVDRESYASDKFIHIVFPSLDSVTEAIFSSLALQDYLRDFPDSDELYALMGMRRFEKNIVGMELSGQTIQRDVVQKVVYFTSHTLENPAPSEQQAREQVAASFFDSLVGNVKKRIEGRKKDKQSQLTERDLLMARLRTASAMDKPALEERLEKLLGSIQSAITSLELGNYIGDFESVLLNPEQYLRLNQTLISLDNMGIRREGNDPGRSDQFMFNELVGYDRRDWIVTMVRCSNLQSEPFAERLDNAYRKLAIPGEIQL